VPKNKSNSDSDKEDKKSESGLNEENSGDEDLDKRDDSQLKNESTRNKVIEHPLSQKVGDPYSLIESKYVKAEDSELQKGGKNRETKKEPGNYQHIDNMESIYDSRLITTYMPLSPDSNDTVEVWKDYVKKLKDFRDTLRRRNERIEENIWKMREKSNILEKELEKVDNNDALLNKIVSLLTEKRNEMRQYFTSV